MSINKTDNLNAFTGNINDASGITATVANTAAYVIDSSMRQLKSIQFTCANHTSGNGAFGVEVSNDGKNWVVYNRLVSNVTNTNAQFDTRVAAPTLSSNTSAIYFFPTSDLFRYIRVFCTITTDGLYSATLQQAG